MTLKPGEVRVVASVDAEHTVVDVCQEEGTVTRGLFSRGECSAGDADGLLTVGESLGNNTYRIKEYIPYTMRGPAAVASPAYRDGWDRVYGARASASN